MPFIPVENVAQIQFNYTFAGQRCQNTLHAQFPTQPTLTDLEDLANAMMTAWDVTIAKETSTQVTLNNVTCIDLTVENGAGFEKTSIAAITGEKPQTPLPNSCTLTFKFTTGYRGRSFRGRWYWVGIVRDSTTGNTVNPTEFTAMKNWMTQLIAAVTAEGWTPVVVSRFANKQPRAAGVATPITGISSDQTIDSQRRRLPGRGA